MKYGRGYTSEQTFNAEKLCQLINSVSESKRNIFSAVMLAYMDGMEAGIVYAQDAKAAIIGH